MGSDAAALLAECARLHDARDWDGLGALFGDRGALVFHGTPGCIATGSREVAALLRAQEYRGLALWPAAPWIGGAVGAAYGWRDHPGEVAGQLTLTPGEVGIARLEVRPAARAGVPRVRRSVRALVVTPGGDVLLLAIHEPGRPERWWITPGGGVEPGEDERTALARELAEEIGLPPPLPDAPCVWTRSHTFVWLGEPMRQDERFYLVPVRGRVDPVAVIPDAGTIDAKWWSLDELAATDEVVAPRRLAEALGTLLREGPPMDPVDVGL